MSGGTTALMAASLALAAASAIATDQAGRADAKSQKAYQEAQMRAHNEAALQNAQNAIKEQTEMSAAERVQQMQNQDAAAREMQKNQIDYLQKKGAAIASSEYGSGVSFDALLADYDRAFAMSRDVTQEQLEMQGVGADINMRGYQDRAAQRINSQQGYIPAPIKGPNTLATALSFGAQAAGTVYGGYSSGASGKAAPANTNKYYDRALGEYVSNPVRH